MKHMSYNSSAVWRLSISSICAASLAPAAVQAQTVNLSYVDNIFSGLKTVLAAAIPVLVALALALFIWGLVVFIANSGSDNKRDEGKSRMVWGVIALFVIVSVWGIVEILQDLTGADGNVGTITAPGVPD